MDKKALCERYIELINNLKAKESALADAFKAINSDNYFIGLVPDEYNEFTDEILAILIGDTAFDWVSWWLFETDQTYSKIWIDGEEIDINSFDDLWEAAIKDA